MILIFKKTHFWKSGKRKSESWKCKIELRAFAGGLCFILGLWQHLGQLRRCHQINRPLRLGGEGGGSVWWIRLSQVYTWLPLTLRGPVVGTSRAAGADEPDRQGRRDRERICIPNVECVNCGKCSRLGPWQQAFKQNLQVRCVFESQTLIDLCMKKVSVSLAPLNFNFPQTGLIPWTLISCLSVTHRYQNSFCYFPVRKPLKWDKMRPLIRFQERSGQVFLWLGTEQDKMNQWTHACQRARACCLFTCRQHQRDPGFATKANTDSEKSLMETITTPIKGKQTVDGAHLEEQVCDAQLCVQPPF